MVSVNKLIMHQGPYSQHFIFFLTEEWTQKAWVLCYARIESLASEKNSSLLEKFVSYKENKVWWIGL